MVDTEKTVTARLAKLVELDPLVHDRVEIMQMAVLKIDSLKSTNGVLRAQLEESMKEVKPAVKSEFEDMPIEELLKSFENQDTEAVTPKRRRSKK